MTYDLRYDKLQKALIEARHAAGLTQAEVAARLHKHQSFVSKYEMGERKLDVIELIDICEIFEIDPCNFLPKLLIKLKINILLD
jgi:transcriptional regulator with XRE-family HTH domain